MTLTEYVQQFPREDFAYLYELLEREDVDENEELVEALMKGSAR